MWRAGQFVKLLLGGMCSVAWIFFGLVGYHVLTWQFPSIEIKQAALIRGWSAMLVLQLGLTQCLCRLCTRSCGMHVLASLPVRLP